ncbi:MAG: hypothetical protein JW881_02080 [Spirochaetales bacterium]|nr:hypothetical protein [Spirochaetales bacterium]
MPQKVSSFDELSAFIISFGVEETEAIHIAEEFMDKNNIEFDADGNFSALNVEFSKEKKAVTTC